MSVGWLQGLVAAVPGRCGVCARWPAEPVCSRCIAEFAGPRARCARCALPVPAGVRECGACVRRPPPLDSCAAAVAYGYPWSGLVAAFKFQGEPGWARAFAGLLARTAGVAESVSRADVVIPMPLAPLRLAERGFNQALEIARQLAANRRVDASLLLRLRETPAQASLGREERLANVRGAFGLDPLRANSVRGATLLLVDDVMTSGASLFAAAQALRAAGAARVSAAVFARTDEPG